MEFHDCRILEAALDWWLRRWRDYIPVIGTLAETASYGVVDFMPSKQ